MSVSRETASGLLFLGLAKQRCLGQGEQDDLFAGCGANVVVQTQHRDAGHLQHHRFQEWPRQLDQLRSHLLEQIPPFPIPDEMTSMAKNPLPVLPDDEKPARPPLTDIISARVLHQLGRPLLRWPCLLADW